MADNHAKGRVGRRWKTIKTKGTALCVVVCLVTTTLHSGPVVVNKHPQQGEDGRWVYALDHNGESGDKRGRTMSRPRPPCVHSRLVYGAEGVCFAYLCILTGNTWQTQTHSALQSNSHQQTDTGSSAKQRLRTTKWSRQRSKLAEGSQEGERVVKGEDLEKWDKDQGEAGMKTILVKKKRKWLVGQEWKDQKKT